MEFLVCGHRSPISQSLISSFKVIKDILLFVV